MRSNIGVEMVDFDVVVQLETPVWRDKAGCNHDEKDACGFQVDHDDTHHDYSLMADEVGGNLNQKGDGYRGEIMLTCERGTVPKK